MWLETMTCRPFFGEVGEEVDHLGPAHRVEPVQRFVKHQNLRIMAVGVGELDPLPHALGVSGDSPVGGIGETDPGQCGPGAFLRLALRVSVKCKGEKEEAEPGRAVWEVVVLGAVTDQAKEIFGAIGGHARAPRPRPDSVAADRSSGASGCSCRIRWGPRDRSDPGATSRLTLLTPRTSP